MRERGLMPAFVVCSDARRAIETWEAMKATLAPLGAAEIAMEAHPGLYLAPARQALAIVRALPDARSSVLLIGHNPGLQNLAGALAGPASDPVALRRLRLGFPTAGLAVFAFDMAHWCDIGRGKGRLSLFLPPVDGADAT